MKTKIISILLFYLSPGLGFIYFNKFKQGIIWNVIYAIILSWLAVKADFFSGLFWGTFVGLALFLCFATVLLGVLLFFALRLAVKHESTTEPAQTFSLKQLFWFQVVVFIFLNSWVSVRLLVSAQSKYAIYSFKSRDMAPAIRPGDVIMFSKQGFALQRGDIVLAEPPDSSGKLVIKRIMAVPGDTIEIKDLHKLYVNGKLSKAYYRESGEPAHVILKDKVTLSDDCFFLIGDNVMRSQNDSIDKGCFSQQSVKARFEYVVFARNL